VELAGKTANDVWAASWVALHGEAVTRVNGKGTSRELLHVTLNLSDPRRRWVTNRRPAINPAFALVEVVWIVRGRSDSDFLTAWNKQLPRFAGHGSTSYGAYGERLRERFGFDQLQRAVQALQHSPNQRQVVLQVWDPTTDLPRPDGKSQSEDIPCNIASIVKLSEGRLEWLQVMRSNDLIRGLPYNLVQRTTLQELFAGWVGSELGTYVHLSDSLHIYEEDVDGFDLKELDPMPAPIIPDLRLAWDDSMRVFARLEGAIEVLARATQVGAITEALGQIDHPGYLDWLLVIASERLRRIGSPLDSIDLAERVTSSDLRMVHKLWLSRFREFQAWT
jgi:thymidylate synthase